MVATVAALNQKGIIIVTTIQQQIDSLSARGGGRLCVPPGDYRSQGRIIIPSGVELIGSGPGSCTIRSVGTRQAVVTPDARRYYLGIQGFAVFGDSSDGYIGIDFRFVTLGFIRRCYIPGFQTGVVLNGPCYYNELDQVATDCSVDGIEISGGANQNTLLNCKPSAPIAVHILGSNGTTILGGSGEGATPGNFIKQVGVDAVGTCVKNFRGEAPGFGPVWCNADNLVGSF